MTVEHDSHAMSLMVEKLAVKGSSFVLLYLQMLRFVEISHVDDFRSRRVVPELLDQHAGRGLLETLLQGFERTVLGC